LRRQSDGDGYSSDRRRHAGGRGGPVDRGGCGGRRNRDRCNGDDRGGRDKRDNRRERRTREGSGELRESKAVRRQAMEPLIESSDDEKSSRPAMGFVDATGDEPKAEQSASTVVDVTQLKEILISSYARGCGGAAEGVRSSQPIHSTGHHQEPAEPT